MLSTKLPMPDNFFNKRPYIQYKICNNTYTLDYAYIKGTQHIFKFTYEKDELKIEVINEDKFSKLFPINL